MTRRRSCSGFGRVAFALALAFAYDMFAGFASVASLRDAIRVEDIAWVGVKIGVDKGRFARAVEVKECIATIDTT